MQKRDPPGSRATAVSFLYVGEVLGGCANTQRFGGLTISHQHMERAWLRYLS